MNKLIYFEANEAGKEVKIAEPVVEESRKYAYCDYEEKDSSGIDYSRYGFEYHIAQSKDALYFVGKQDDFMYELLVTDYEKTNKDIQMDVDKLIHCINEGVVDMKLKFVPNEWCTDDCNIRRKGNKLAYDIRLTDKVYIKVLAPIDAEEHTVIDWFNDIFRLEQKVREGNYCVLAYAKSVTEEV